MQETVIVTFIITHKKQNYFLSY